MTGSSLLSGLDQEQQAVVTAGAGPVCVLAGAGTGKTRAITHRIAHRVVTGQVQPGHVLAVTFTSRAAAQLRERLAALGATGVQARTFHAAALRQLKFFAPRLLRGRELPELVESKSRLITLAAARAGIKADRVVARDLAGEIEWAKSTLVEPGEYAVAAAKAGRESPVDSAQVDAVFAAYEKAKRTAGQIDFEDLLRAMCWGIEEHSDVAEQIRSRYRHFVVDEYQDVNPLQQRLLEAWLGGRRDVTVVGDAAQTIYSFTGATSAYLVDFARLHRDTTVVRLNRDYRSTPQVVGLANAVIRQARGSEAKLRLDLIGQRPSGPEPDFKMYPDETEEAAAVARRCAELIASGVPAAEIAVLYRANAQSETYEEALAALDVPYVLRGGERFFERGEIRQAMAALRALVRQDQQEDLLTTVSGVLIGQGWQPERPPSGGAARERWESQAALVRLADDMARAKQRAASPFLETTFGEPNAAAAPRTELGEFVAELDRRAEAQHAPTVAGVTLASLHSSKGLEWDAVFLVGLAEGTLPTTYARTPEAVEEERRLLYVGITRARQWLWLSYGEARSPGGRPRKPCRFVMRWAPGSEASVPRQSAPKAPDKRRVALVSCRVCGATLLAGVDRKLARCSTCPSTLDEVLLARLQKWRAETAAAASVPAYVIFTDATLEAIAERQPSDTPGLLAIAGIGSRKLELYGKAVFSLLEGREP